MWKEWGEGHTGQRRAVFQNLPELPVVSTNREENRVPAKTDSSTADLKRESRLTKLLKRRSFCPIIGLTTLHFVKTQKRNEMWHWHLCHKWYEDDFLLFWHNSWGFSNFLKHPLHQIASPANEMQTIKNVCLPPQQVLCGSSMCLQPPLLTTKALPPPPCNSELFGVNGNK